MAPFLHLAHVNVARGENIVLHDINLTVNTGEHIAILGPNGCGKSTLIKTITCECYPLVRPETKVSIFGRERWDLTELKKRLGVVAAELPGKPTLTTTGLDAVLTGFFSSSTLWPNLTVTEAMRTRADEVLHQIDAVHLADKPPEIDRILMMKDGRIIADGPKADLLTAPRLSNLFKTEVHLTHKDGFHHAW